MFRNYLIIALRNFRRNKTLTVINITGLAIGMAAALLMLEYVFYELSFDRFHANKDNIYRVIIQTEIDGELSSTSYITAAVAPSMAEEFPQVKGFVRFVNPTDAYLTFDNHNFQMENLSYTDSSLFDIFSFKLIKGNPETALAEPYQLVLTESIAHKVFGNDDPMGKVVRLNGQENMLVTGVMKDFPGNSQLNFGALVSFSTLYLDTNLFLDWNGGWNYFSYIQLQSGSDRETIGQRFPDFMEKNINYLYRQHGFVLHLDLQPLTKVHLFSSREYGIDEAGNLTSLYIFSSIAAFILLIACINFINLTSARSFSRSREIGLRKVVGANRQTIIIQFLFETMLASLMAFGLAIVLVDLFQDNFNRLLGSSLSIFGVSAWKVVIGMIILVILTGFIAGIYPAWLVSRFQPVTSIKGTMISGRGKTAIRNILTVFQFTIALVLIIFSSVIYLQIRFINSRPLGLNKENIYIIPLVSEASMKNYHAIRDAFGKIPQVIGTAATSDIPGSGFTMNGYLPEGMKEPVMINVVDVDESYLDLMGIPIVQGRGFDPGVETDRTAFLINETLAKQMGWDNPVGKKIYRDGEHKVIGVVGDFHFSSLHHQIKSLIITKDPWIGYNFLSVKVSPDELGSTIEKMEAAWSSILPAEPFTYFSHDQFMHNVYSGDQTAGEAILWFSLLAIFIACLGLLGLANFTFNQRKKEIGIRKVLGAETAQIVRRVMLDFLQLVFIAGCIAFPVSWWMLERWLDNFAFRTNVSPIVFVLPVIAVGILAWLTIIFQVRRLANTNPAEVLQFE